MNELVTIYSKHQKLNLSLLSEELELTPTVNPEIFHAKVPLEVAVVMESIPGCASRVLDHVSVGALPAIADEALPEEAHAQQDAPDENAAPKPSKPAPTRAGRKPKATEVTTPSDPEVAI